MVKADQVSDRFFKPKAGHPPYYLEGIKVVFMDMVGFSRNRLTREMASKVQTLQNAIFEVLDPHFYWDEKGGKKPNQVIIIPTGDGYAIAFHPRVESKQILKLVDQIYRKIVNGEQIEVRFGISAGPHILFVDLNGILNLVGEGIIRANRAMTIAHPKQILCTAEFAAPVYSDFAKRLAPLPGKWRLKSEQPFELFIYTHEDKIGVSTEPDAKYKA